MFNSRYQKTTEILTDFTFMVVYVFYNGTDTVLERYRFNYNFYFINTKSILNVYFLCVNFDLIIKKNFISKTAYGVLIFTWLLNFHVLSLCLVRVRKKKKEEEEATRLCVCVHFMTLFKYKIY